MAVGFVLPDEDFLPWQSDNYLERLQQEQQDEEERLRQEQEAEYQAQLQAWQEEQQKIAEAQAQQAAAEERAAQENARLDQQLQEQSQQAWQDQQQAAQPEPEPYQPEPQPYQPDEQQFNDYLQLAQDMAGGGGGRLGLPSQSRSRFTNTEDPGQDWGETPQPDLMPTPVPEPLPQIQQPPEPQQSIDDKMAGFQQELDQFQQNRPTYGPPAPDLNAPSNEPGPSFTGGALAPNQFDSGLTTAEAMAACGPAAYVAFARAMGRNPTMREAVDLARQYGWNEAGGMNGVANEDRMLRAQGIPTRLDRNVDESAIQHDVNTGNPVIISTSGHYFVVDGYDPDTGKYHTGNTGTAYRNGAPWLNLSQMQSLSGGINGVLYLDSPASPRPSVATGDADRGYGPNTNPYPLGAIDNSSPDAFLRSIRPYAEQVQQETGIPAAIMMGIAANETGYGKYATGNNYFGIKGRNPDTGASFNSPTWEVYNGQRTNITDTFRSYDSPADSFRDFARFLNDNSRYRDALTKTTDPEAFIRSVQGAGYATDPNWANQVLSIARRSGEPLAGSEFRAPGEGGSVGGSWQYSPPPTHGPEPVFNQGYSTFQFGGRDARDPNGPPSFQEDPIGWGLDTLSHLPGAVGTTLDRMYGLPNQLPDMPDFSRNFEPYNPESFAAQEQARQEQSRAESDRRMAAANEAGALPNYVNENRYPGIEGLFRNAFKPPENIFTGESMDTGIPQLTPNLLAISGDINKGITQQVANFLGTQVAESDPYLKRVMDEQGADAAWNAYKEIHQGELPAPAWGVIENLPQIISGLVGPGAVKSATPAIRALGELAAGVDIGTAGAFAPLNALSYAGRGAANVGRELLQDETAGIRLPNRVYHGTGGAFDTPDPFHFDPNGLYGPGYYLTSDPRLAGSYAETRGQEAWSGDKSLWELVQEMSPEDKAQWEEKTTLARRLMDRAVDMPYGTEKDFVSAQANKAMEEADNILRPPVGANVRAVDLPAGLNLFDIDGEVDRQTWHGIGTSLANLAQEDGLSPNVVRNFYQDMGRIERDGAIPTGEDTYEYLKDALSANLHAVNKVLSDSGYDGITHQGGMRVPMLDESGRPIRHDVAIVFPDKLDKVTNAFSGKLGGHAEAGFASELGGAAAGAATSQIGTDENTTPEERWARLGISTLGGAGLGHFATSSLGRRLGSEEDAFFGLPNREPLPEQGDYGANQALRSNLFPYDRTQSEYVAQSLNKVDRTRDRLEAAGQLTPDAKNELDSLKNDLLDMAQEVYMRGRDINPIATEHDLGHTLGDIGDFNPSGEGGYPAQATPRFAADIAGAAAGGATSQLGTDENTPQDERLKRLGIGTATGGVGMHALTGALGELNTRLARKPQIPTPTNPDLARIEAMHAAANPPTPVSTLTGQALQWLRNNFADRFDILNALGPRSELAVAAHLGRAESARLVMEERVRPVIEELTGGDYNLTKDFNTYVKLQRDIEVMQATGQPNRLASGGITNLTQAENDLKDLEAHVRAQPEGDRAWERILLADDRRTEAINWMRDSMLATGRISQDTYNALQLQPHYNPVRLQDLPEMVGNAGNRFQMNSAGIRRLTQHGHYDDTDPPLDSFTRAMLEGELMNQRNEHMQAFIDELGPRAVRVPNVRISAPGPVVEPRVLAGTITTNIQRHPALDEPGIVSVFRNGERELYRVAPDIERAIKGLDHDTFNNFEKVFRQVNEITRQGATVLSPSFTFTNLLADAVTTFIREGAGTTARIPANWYHAWMQDDVWRDFMLHGGGSSGMWERNPHQLLQEIRRSNGLVVENRNDLIRYMENFMPDAAVGLLVGGVTGASAPEDERWQKALAAGGGAAVGRRFLGRVNEAVELAPRLATYQAHLARGETPQEAAMAGRRVTVDFGRAGEFARHANQFILFFNAAAQGSLQVGRTVRDAAQDLAHGSPTGGFNPRGAAPLTRIALLATLAGAAYRYNLTRPDYFDIPEDIRRSGIVLMSPFHEPQPDPNIPGGYKAANYIYIPMREWSVFTGPIGYAFEKIHGKEPKGFWETATNLGSTILPGAPRGDTGLAGMGLNPVVLPKTLMEIKTNTNYFTGRPITPRDQEGRPISQQTTERTSAFAMSPVGRELANRLGVTTGGTPWSPIQFDYFVRGVLGTAGANLLDASNAAANRPLAPGAIPVASGLFRGVARTQTGQARDRLYNELGDAIAQDNEAVPRGLQAIPAYRNATPEQQAHMERSVMNALGQRHKQELGIPEQHLPEEPQKYRGVTSWKEADRIDYLIRQMEQEDTAGRKSSLSPADLRLARRYQGNYTAQWERWHEKQNTMEQDWLRQVRPDLLQGLSQ